MLLSIGIAFCFDDSKRWFVAISPRLLFENRMYNFAEPNLLCKYVNAPKSPCPLLDRGCSRPFKNSIILSADLVELSVGVRFCNRAQATVVCSSSPCDELLHIGNLRRLYCYTEDARRRWAQKNIGMAAIRKG